VNGLHTYYPQYLSRRVLSTRIFPRCEERVPSGKAFGGLTDVRSTSVSLCRTNQDIAGFVIPTEKALVCRWGFDYGSAIVTARLVAKKTMNFLRSGQNGSASKTSGSVQVEVGIRLLTANRRGPYANHQPTTPAK